MRNHYLVIPYFVVVLKSLTFLLTLCVLALLSIQENRFLLLEVMIKHGSYGQCQSKYCFCAFCSWYIPIGFYHTSFQRVSIILFTGVPKSLFFMKQQQTGFYFLVVKKSWLEKDITTGYQIATLIHSKCFNYLKGSQGQNTSWFHMKELQKIWRMLFISCKNLERFSRYCSF